MSAPILLVVVPGGLSPVLATALSIHPALVVRDGADLSGLRTRLDSHTRARAQSARMPWDTEIDWVDRLVETTVGRFVGPTGARRAVWVARDPAQAPAIADTLGATVLRWIADPRHALPTDVPPTTATAAAAGERWATHRRAALALQGVAAHAAPAEVFSGLGIAPDPGTESALSLLRGLPAPQLPAPLLGALASHPDVAIHLRECGVIVPPVPETAATLVVRAAATSSEPERAVLAERVLSMPIDAPLRARAIDLLIESGQAAQARDHLVRWLRRDDAVEAWTRLLTNQTGTPDPGWTRQALRHPDARVRGALGRWLVQEGLDRQAAETLCRVRDTPWFQPG